METQAAFMMIISMGIVTYIPRMLPFVLLGGRSLPSFIQGILKNIPYAVLGALIFPGIFFVQEGNILYGATGLAVALIIAWTGANIIFVVLGSIVALSLFAEFFF
ncbi:MAG: AzlD domain-containing protein [Bacillus sp. (in: firmicutes)]